jgi:hypothetical protein
MAEKEFKFKTLLVILAGIVILIAIASYLIDIFIVSSL